MIFVTFLPLVLLNFPDFGGFHNSGNFAVFYDCYFYNIFKSRDYFCSYDTFKP
jgi:hypothetical protein